MPISESDQRIGRRYGKLANLYDASRFGGPFGTFHAGNMLWLIDRLLPKDLKPCRVLDVAAGTGIVALHLARQGHEVSATDISEPMVRLGDQKARAMGLKVGFSVGNARELPYPDASFDVLVSTMFLYLDWAQEDRLAFMKEMHRVLKPNGLLLLEIMNPFWSGTVDWYQQFLPERCHTGSTRRETAEYLQGFRTLDGGSCNYPKLGWVHAVSRRLATALSRRGRWPPLAWFGLERYLLLQKM